jgi:hypothetical protein
MLAECYSPQKTRRKKCGMGKIILPVSFIPRRPLLSSPLRADMEREEALDV